MVFVERHGGLTTSSFSSPFLHRSYDTHTLSRRVPTIGGSTTNAVIIFVGVGLAAIVLVLVLYLLFLSKRVLNRRMGGDDDYHSGTGGGVGGGTTTVLTHQTSLHEIPKLFPATRPTSLYSNVSHLPSVGRSRSESGAGDQSTPSGATATVTTTTTTTTTTIAGGPTITSSGTESPSSSSSVILGATASCPPSPTLRNSSSQQVVSKHPSLTTLKSQPSLLSLASMSQSMMQDNYHHNANIQIPPMPIGVNARPNGPVSPRPPRSPPPPSVALYHARSSESVRRRGEYLDGNSFQGSCGNGDGDDVVSIPDAALWLRQARSLTSLPVLQERPGEGSTCFSKPIPF